MSGNLPRKGIPHHLRCQFLTNVEAYDPASAAMRHRPGNRRYQFSTANRAQMRLEFFQFNPIRLL